MTLPAICESPIFIIGSPRSGTSILAWSLAQHSMLTSWDESNMFFELFRDDNLDGVYERASSRPDSGDWLRKCEVSSDEFLASIGLGINALVTSRSDAVRWIDQTPINTLIAPTLARAFPGAKFIHILRDGRSVVNSMINFASAFKAEARDEFVQAGAMPEFATDFRAACATWARYVAAAMNFAIKNPERCLTVRNEELRAHLVPGFQEILEFLEVDLEPAVATYFRDRKLNSSFPEASLPGGGGAPWEDWSDSQKETFETIAGRMMALLDNATGTRVGV
ncbi:MAG TPA: sulfotransferase [Thermoanaerobaculia bacterium]|jgi:hypothetical protein